MRVLKMLAAGWSVRVACCDAVGAVGGAGAAVGGRMGWRVHSCVAEGASGREGHSAPLSAKRRDCSRPLRLLRVERQPCAADSRKVEGHGNDGGGVSSREPAWPNRAAAATGCLALVSIILSSSAYCCS